MEGSCGVAVLFRLAGWAAGRDVELKDWQFVG